MSAPNGCTDKGCLHYDHPMTHRPALTEPATEAGRQMAEWLSACSVGMLDVPATILAIEAEAVQREREALVERVARNLWETIWRGSAPSWDSTLDDGWREQYRVVARRLLGIEA